jgi:dolichyl-phosphate beta-glucosyltransferase
LSPNPRSSLPEEETYLSASSPSQAQPLPSTIDDPPSLELSVIVPAYNEAKRLPKMLKEALEHLREKYKKGSWEIIIVDDGSKDNTVEVAMKIARDEKEDHIRVVKLVKNRGKGGAVTHVRLSDSLDHQVNLNFGRCFWLLYCFRACSMLEGIVCFL